MSDVPVDPIGEREAQAVDAELAKAAMHTNGEASNSPKWESGPPPGWDRPESSGRTSETVLVRVPPHDLDAEAAVLCTVMLADAIVAKGRPDPILDLGFLKPEHFYSEPHRRIFEAAVDLRANDQAVDLVQVATWLKDRGRIEQVGGVAYLRQIADASAYLANVVSYATTIHEKARIRELISRCQRVVAEGHLDYGDPQAFIDALGAEVAELAARNPEEGARCLTASGVLDAWSREGRVVHEPTGIEALDARTGGGPIYGTRWLFVGAPDAGKTALLVQIAHTYALRGICVGLLCVDEEAGDIVTRLAQRSGWSRDDCETRDPDSIERMRSDLAKLPIRLYGDEHTIESAAADLAAWARKLGKRAVFGCDSIQTVSSDALRSTNRELGPREAVTANMRALRSVATKHRLIALATSEMNRGGYKDRGKRGEEPVNDMASAAESRAIEYLTKVLVTLLSVAGGGGDVELKISKNKHGPSWRSEDDSLFYALDRARQTFTPTAGPDADEEDRAEASRERSRRDMALVAAMLASKPAASGIKRLKAAMRAKHAPFSDARTAATLEALGDAIIEAQGERNSKLIYLDGSKLEPEVVALVPLDERSKLLAARPPPTLDLDGSRREAREQEAQELKSAKESEARRDRFAAEDRALSKVLRAAGDEGLGLRGLRAGMAVELGGCSSGAVDVALVRAAGRLEKVGTHPRTRYRLRTV